MPVSSDDAGEIDVEEGLWAYQVINSSPAGLELRCKPTHSPHCKVYPTQVYPDDAIVLADKRLRMRDGGSMYVHVKDTEGWLFVARGREPVLLPVGMSKGFWAYKVIGSTTEDAGLALRRTPTRSRHDKVYPNHVYLAGAIVFADIQLHVDNNSTYVRVKDTSGWLFTSAQPGRPEANATRGVFHVATLLPVEVLEGRWVYQVNNPEFGGLSLRRTPTHNAQEQIYPPQMCSHGAIVLADQLLTVNGITYVRVKETTGWLFVSRHGKQTLVPQHLHHHVNISVPTGSSKDSSDKTDTTRCAVCKEQNRDALLEPCICICMQCADKVYAHATAREIACRCPICRQVFATYKKGVLLRCRM